VTQVLDGAQAQGLELTETYPTVATGLDPSLLSKFGQIEVKVAVELGSAQLPLRDLAAVQPGSVLVLDRRVGEPINLVVNGRLFARGTTVVIGDQLGVKITQIVREDGAERG
jgi:flagellar motor switch protein FliN